MTILKVEVRLPYTSNLPRDVAVNVFHFQTPTPALTEHFAEIATIVGAFYNTTTTASAQIADYISPVVSRATNACVMRFSDAQADPAPTLEEVRWTLGATAATISLPLELAICSSVYATPGIPVPIRRRRGRNFIGPLTNGTIQNVTNQMPVVADGTRQTIAGAAKVMADQEGVCVWSVYSRTDDAAYQIVGGWVDNEFDVQRRREMDATARTTWVVDSP